MKQQLGEKYQQVKDHVKENKTVYVACGATAAVTTLLVGAGAVAIVLQKGTIQTAAVVQGVAYKSPVTQHVIQQAIPRAGHAGKVFTDREDPTKMWMSTRKLMDDLGVTRHDVQRYLAGNLSHLAGRQVDLVLDGAPALVAEMTVKA